MRTETRKLKCPLTDSEVASRAALQATEALEHAKLEGELETWWSSAREAKKAREKKITEKAGEVLALARQVASRSEERHVECLWHADLDGGYEYLTRNDTGQAIERRKLSEERRQLVIGEKLQEANTNQLKLWEEQLRNNAPEIEAGDEQGGGDGLDA